MAKKQTDKQRKELAKKQGYYQPKEPQDDLFSFEVYFSKEECQKDYPDQEISTYFGDDIEDFQFVD